MTTLFLNEMLESAAWLLPSRDRCFFYCIGAGQEDLAAPLMARSPGATPVLIGTSPEELVRVRDALHPAQAMGFVLDVFQEGWARELPPAPAVVSVAYRLSRVRDRVKVAFLETVCDLLCEDGILIWSDLFLPQSIDTYRMYQEAEAALGRARAPELSLERSLRRVAADHAAVRYPCLLKRAREMLYSAGFSNIEVPYSRYSHTVIVACK